MKRFQEKMLNIKMLKKILTNFAPKQQQKKNGYQNIKMGITKHILIWYVLNLPCLSLSCV